MCLPPSRSRTYTIPRRLASALIFFRSALTLPDFFDLDGDKLQEEIYLFTDMVFQDTDFQYLFEPATDGIDESEIGERLGFTSLNFADTFRPFQNRIGHPFHVAEFDDTQ